MPNDEIIIETDGDPKTAYEDTTAHERPGFMIEDSEHLSEDNKKQSDELRNS